MERLEGKRAIVTGAGNGIGRAIALRLAEDEAAVAIWDINGDSAAETAKAITDAGGNAIAIEHIKLENEGWEHDLTLGEPTEV